VFFKAINKTLKQMKKALFAALLPLCFVISLEVYAQNPNKSSGVFIQKDIVEKPVSTNSTKDIKNEIDDLNKEIDGFSRVSQKVDSELKKIDDAISSLLLGKTSATSLMFDNIEIENIDRAVFALKNGELFTSDDYNAGSKTQLSDAEKSRMEQDKRERERAENNKKSYIYLASIMYFSQDEWTIWINDAKITSKNNSPNNEFFIKKIKADEAQILWTLSVSKWRVLSGKNPEVTPPNLNSRNLVEIEFSLKPNQTFVLKMNFVTEGKNVSYAVAKKEEQIRREQKNGVKK